MRSLSEHDGDRDGGRGVLARIVEPDVRAAERVRLIGRLAATLARSRRRLVDLTIEAAPRIPVRDLATLRRHHGGLDGDELADALVRSAGRTSAAIGGAGGVLSSMEWAAPPTLLSTPVQLAAETLAVVSVELKLVAELHAVYDAVPPGTPTQRATAYLVAWSRRRAVDLGGSGAVLPALSEAARRELRQRILRRLGRNSATMIPFLAGAAAGATLNGRDTRALGERVGAQLRGRRRRG